MTTAPGIDPTVPPSGSGCVECLAGDGPGWWMNLRRCAQCGHIGCCDSSPSGHASAHARAEGHPIIASYEPGESWFWSFDLNEAVDGPALAPPLHRPLDQAKPGPEGKVPEDWAEQLH
jgi:hypothetical protein